MAATQPAPLSVIGKAQPRVDGPLKVSGKAMYTSDHHFPGMLYAVPVCATIANGEAQKIDTSTAEEMPGVRAIFVRSNIGKLFRASESFSPDAAMSHVDETRPPLEDDVVRYYGQYVALAVADTFEQASAAADAVKVTYREQKPNMEEQLTPETKPKVESERGDAAKAFGAAAIQVDQTYDLPPETHNPIELHASVAVWDGTAFTLYETTQGVVNHRNVLAQMLGVPNDKVRVVSKFLGSGFGGKLFPWTQSALAAAAARQLGKPVKLVVSRQMMFQSVGHRPRVSQRIRFERNARRQADLAAPGLGEPHVDSRRLQGELRRGHTVLVQRAQSAHHVRIGATQRGLTHRHARTGRGAGLVGDRVGDGRAGAKARHGPRTAASGQRAEDR